MKSEFKNLQAKDYIDQLASGGRYQFTSAEAKAALGVSADAAKLAINRLSRQGLVATPAKGFYLIIPPEYRSLGCLPADQFIPGLMEQLKLPYYAGLLSAAQYYGAAHQRPQAFQVFVEKNRRPLNCGKVRVKFIARKWIKDVPVRTLNTARGRIRVSSPEATAIDLVGYSQHAGGLEQVAIILSELSSELDPVLLESAAKTAPLSWAQRLGYLLEVVDAKDVTSQLEVYIRENARDYSLLVPGISVENVKRVKTWKLIVNAEIEPDL